MKRQTTKERIIKAAEELMLENSFHSVGLKQILDAVKVPKGSFYYYFASKEQFGVEMLKHYMEETSERKRAMLLSTEEESNPLKRLFNYLNFSITVIESVIGKFPCLAFKLASEVSDLSEAMREELNQGFDDWICIFAQVLDEAIEAKLLSDQVDTKSEAQFILDAWSGSIQRAVISHSADPVKNAVNIIIARINTMKP